MSQYLPIAIAIAVFMAMAGVGLLIYTFAAGGRRRQLVRRLEDTSTGSNTSGAGKQDEWITRMAAQGQQLDKLLQKPEETTILLAQAGWRGAKARALFYGFQILLPIVVLLAAIPFWFTLAALAESGLALSVIAAAVILALLLPRMVLRSVAKKRREKIARESTLFINLLILLFEAGLNSRQALVSLVNDGPDTLPNIVDELQPILRQVEAGADLSGLLSDAGKTLNIPEIETIFGILRQVERYGGEIREPLTEALDVIEERRSLALREQVNILSGKMTVVLVACFFPALLIMIVGPGVASIFTVLKNL